MSLEVKMVNQNQIKIIEEDIKKAENYLSKESSKEVYDFFNHLNAAYKNIGEIYISVPSAVLTSSYFDTPINFEKYREHLKRLIKRLELYKAKLQDEDEKAMNSSQSNPAITIHNNNTNTANANISQNITIKNTMEKIDQIQDLPKNLRYELKGMLSELEDCKNNEEKKSKLMEAVKWLGDKTADATIACLPYLAGLAF